MTDKVSLYKAGHWPTTVAAHGAEKCQQDGTSGSRLSIPRETLELCGIFLHTNEACSGGGCPPAGALLHAPRTARETFRRNAEAVCCGPKGILNLKFFKRQTATHLAMVADDRLTTWNRAPTSILSGISMPSALAVVSCGEKLNRA